MELIPRKCEQVRDVNWKCRLITLLRIYLTPIECMEWPIQQFLCQ